MNIKAAILSVIMAGSSFAYATTTTDNTTSRVAVVDMHAILEKLPQMQTMRTDLEKQFTTDHDSLTAAQDTLKEKAEKLASNKAVMTKTAYTAEQTALKTEQKTLQTKQTSFQQKVFAAQDSAMKKVLSEITTVVSKIATENNYDVVVPKNSTVYVAKSYDITTQVQAAMTSE
jgi:outer membrane protein